MTPFANFTFFLLLLYAVVPIAVLGLLGRATPRWGVVCTLPVLAILLCDHTNSVELWPGREVLQVWIVLGYALWQGALAFAFLRARLRRGKASVSALTVAVVLSLAPLAFGKFLPLFTHEFAFGFLGISYVTFRALDVIFSIHDGVLKSLSPTLYAGYVFFFSTLLSGPVDRYRRFAQDWARTRSRADFLDDLDGAISAIMRGFLYKFIVAALVKTWWLDRIGVRLGPWDEWGYMYAYTAYLFFDFAGYSAFAVGLSRFIGIRTPENFSAPFLARNLRDFWTRWHISLSFWFRDHVHLRFMLAAAKGKWFRGKHTANYLGLLLTFGLMGVWHGTEAHYLLYGLYHAALLCGYDAFARWNKTRATAPPGRAMTAFNIVLTGHVVAFGLLLFSGRLTPKPPPAQEAVAEKITHEEIVGYAWDHTKPNGALTIEISIDYGAAQYVKADDFREDLRVLRYGDGRHGFRFPLAGWVRPGGTHHIEARVLELNLPLRGTPTDVAVPH